MTNNDHKLSSRKRRLPGQRLVWLLMGLLVALLLVPVSGYWLSDTVAAQSDAATKGNERASLWREVRRGATGYTAVSGPEANVLIQNGGQNWRSFKDGPLRIYSAWLMAGVLLVAGLLHMINGPQRLKNGFSGQMIERWTRFERIMHWYVAILFIILAVTGLSLLYGRSALIPVFGKDGFAAYAEVAKALHNYLGPFFAVGTILMGVRWFRDNLPIKADWEWAKTAGGMWGEGRPPAGKANAGEKLMYWQFVVTGLALVVTGFVLDFPTFGQTREVMQWSQVIHAVAAIIAIVTAFGHMYMALIGVEGALEGMVNGRVDINWAEQHHDLWYQELLGKGIKPEPSETRRITPDGQPAARST